MKETENKVGHTPGPWRLGKEWHQESRTILSGNEPVAKCFVGECAEANARLIASAPELLEAFEKLLVQARRAEGFRGCDCSTWYGQDFVDAIEGATNAISKSGVK